MTFNDIKTALLSVTKNVSHFNATGTKGAKGNYIVWGEDGQAGSLWADNEMINQAISGTIDYFTKIEYDSKVEAIQKAISAIGLSYRLNSVQYEKDTGYIHYEWVWEIG